MVTVYGKANCGLCESAKEKLQRMGIPYRSADIVSVTELHTNWRTDDTIEVMACYHDIDTLPVLVLDDGKAYSYPEAMKTLKRRRKSENKQETPELAVAS